MFLVCPVCKNRIAARKHGACPRCATVLDIFTWNHEGKRHSELRVSEPDQKTMALATDLATGVEVQDVTGLVISEPGANPTIVMTQQKPRHYRVTYRLHIPIGWLYCPACNRKMFQNTVFHSGHLEQSHKCDGCYAITIFEFISYITHA